MCGNTNFEVIFLKNNRILIILIYLTLVTLLFCCCGKKDSTSQDSKKESPPTSLTQMEQTIDSIIEALDKEAKSDQQQGGQTASSGSKDSQSSGQGGQGGQGSQGEQQGQQGGQSSQGGQQGQQGSQGSQGGQNQQSSQVSQWQQADKLVKELHKKWNEFEPDATKVGTPADTISSFSDTLDILTNDIASVNMMDTLINANGLYKFIPEFLSHYESKSVDIKKLKFLVRDVIYKSKYDKWEMADSSITQAKALSSNIRSQSKEDTKSTYDATLYALTELEKVTAARQKNLIQIKGNLILSGIKKIEQLNEKEAQKEQKEKKK